MELAIVLVIVLLIFGPKRLPGLGKQLGTGMREFKESITGKGDKSPDDDDDDDDTVRSADRSGDRQQVEAALGRPEGEDAPLSGESTREHTPR
jgi:sec-independent protein translocase protein TatA